MSRSEHPLAAQQPNLSDNRPDLTSGRGINGLIYKYQINQDGSIHVRTMWAGMGDGIGAGGRRYATIEEAAAAVRVARVKALAKHRKLPWSLVDPS